MPIEIRELLIKAVVEDPTKQGPSSGGQGQEGDRQEALIEACVERILEILNDAKER